MVVLLHHAVTEAVQDRRDLGAGGVALGRQGGVGHAVDELGSVGPSQGVLGVGADLAVVRIPGQIGLLRHVIALVLRVAIQDRRHLLAGDGVVGCKGRGGGALHDLVGRGPIHGVRVPLTGGYVHKGAGVGDGRGTFQAVQDGHDHGAGGGGVGGEHIRRRASHHALFIHVFHIVVEPVGNTHIREREFRIGSHPFVLIYHGIQTKMSVSNVT